MITLNEHAIHPPDLIRRILLSWITAVAVEYWLLPQELRALSALDGLAQMSLLRVFAVTAVLTVLLSLAGNAWPTAKAERWAMVTIFAAYAATALSASYTLAFAITCGMALAVLLVYAVKGWNDRTPRRSQVQKAQIPFLCITAGLTLAFFLVVSVWTVYRFLCFGNTTYDFGIFAQMFHNMKTTGLPMTTLERDTWLSHFDVHVSPIYYLMLPLYWLFPDPATLQVLQAAVMASAVIPLWKLGTHHGLTGLQKALVCAVLLLYPAFAGGASYDIHENCFLTPLILWLLYGLDRGSTPITATAGVLTLFVKEDAAVYVAVIGLYILVSALVRGGSQKKLATGGALFGGAVLWFFLVTSYLSQNGDGVMTYRYSNFMYDGSGSLLTVIKAVLLNPLKALYECVDAEKILYIGATLVPVLYLPYLTRRYERYLLLIPYVLINLMSDYTYQHDILFQYNFGSIAFLMYLIVVNLADWKIPWQRIVPLTLAALLCLGSFLTVIMPKLINYTTNYYAREEYYESLRQTLEIIPDDASVTASPYLTPHLSQREILYDLRYTDWDNLLSSEYVAVYLVDTYATDKYGGADILQAILEYYGYQKAAELSGILVIYQRG